jgi:glycosyltransferase involved in cell wall biosynthesis
LPGICEDYAGCGEVVIGGITGFVIPVDDDAAYSTALRQLILSPSLRRFMGENARNLSFRFSHDRQMQGIFEILEGLCRK